MHTELPSAGLFALPIVSPLIASIHPNDPIPFCYPPSLAITPFLCSLNRSMISSSDASNSMSFTKNCVSVFWWMRNSRKKWVWGFGFLYSFTVHLVVCCGCCACVTSTGMQSSFSGYCSGRSVGVPTQFQLLLFRCVVL